MFTFLAAFLGTIAAFILLGVVLWVVERVG
jgi:hypothetical protein